METIKGKFKGIEEYKYKYINGAFGTVNTQGEILLNFYCEKLNLPSDFEINLGGDDSVTTENIIQNKSIPLIRELECGVIMNLEVAKSVYEFLGDTIKSATQNLNSENISEKVDEQG
ncbi:MAG: hypothetical protein ACLSXF_04380 [Clostridium sp.]